MVFLGVFVLCDVVDVYVYVILVFILASGFALLLRSVFLVLFCGAVPLCIGAPQIVRRMLPCCPYGGCLFPQYGKYTSPLFARRRAT